jgi:hypothetical protein
MPQEAGPASRRLIWLVATLPIIALLLFGAYSAVLLPRCGACHARTSKATMARSSAHASVPCAACHVPRGRAQRIAFGFQEVLHVIPFVGGSQRDWSAIPDVRCVRCHAGLEKKAVSARGIRILHASCAKGAACTDCHSPVTHGATSEWTKSYDMERCLQCHISQASTACDTCHVAKDRRERISTGAFSVTHGKEWRRTHGMGDTSTCVVCHDQSKCQKCHGAGLPHGPQFIQTHAQVAAEPSAKCSSCHPKRFCTECHVLPMPHPAGFTRVHSRTAAEARSVCDRCHAASDCTRCHEMHVHPGGAVGSTAGTPLPGPGE